MESSKAVGDSGASCSTFCSDSDNAAVSLERGGRSGTLCEQLASAQPTPRSTTQQSARREWGCWRASWRSVKGHGKEVVAATSTTSLGIHGEIETQAKALRMLAQMREGAWNVERAAVAEHVAVSGYKPLERRMEQLEVRVTAHAEAEIEARIERWKSHMAELPGWDADSAELAAEAAEAATVTSSTLLSHGSELAHVDVAV